MNRLLVVLPASGPDRQLRLLAERSLVAERERGVSLVIRVLDGRATHGRKLDYAKTLAPDYDIVVAMDTDCVVFPGWAGWIERTLADPLIGACGAPRMEPEAGLHPSMLAIRAELYVKTPSFEASEGQDTGVAVCSWIEQQGLYLMGARMARWPAYLGDWWRYFIGNDRDGYEQIWWHLGSGTASAWPGWPRHLGRMARGWLGSRPHQKAVERVRRQRRFIREAERLWAIREWRETPVNKWWRRR